MATLRITIPPDSSWSDSDRVQLFIGTENAADLASSAPAGGAMVLQQPVWPGGYEPGGLGVDPLGVAPLGDTLQGLGLGESPLGATPLGAASDPEIEIEYVHHAVLVCATLPFGVKVIDTAGNATVAVEGVAVIADYPDGVRNLQAAAAAAPGNENKCLLTWTESPHV